MQAREKRKLLEKTLKKMLDQIVLVEGKNDERALDEAVVQAGGVVAVQSRKPERIANILEDGFAGRQALLLFDFDDEGRRKTAEFEEILVGRGLQVDRQGRKAFRALFRLRTLEELPGAMQEVEEETR